MNSEEIINHTQLWVKNFIVKYYMCPFARAEVERQTIEYCVSQGKGVEDVLVEFVECIQKLQSDESIETTLFIVPIGFESFQDFLDLLDYANTLIEEQELEGTFQIASFHPHYQFDGEPEDDPSNFTNRSPYPTLHLLREESIEKVLKHYPSAEQIPQRNIEFCRRKGVLWLEESLKQCKSSSLIQDTDPLINL